ncbi:MAG: hypothetical protein ACRDG4_09810, partial [Chloroflexota bacterium]
MAALVLCLAVLVAVLVRTGLGDSARSPRPASPSPVGAAAAPVTGTATADATAVPAGTAPGTCLAFAPLSGDRHRTVFVDPGHGGVDVGTSGTTSAGSTIYEKGQT